MSTKKDKSVSGSAFDLSLFLRVMKYVKPYKAMFLFTAFMVVLSALLAPLRPLLIQYTLDNSVMIPDLEMLTFLTIVIIGLLILESVVQFVQTYLANWLGQTVIRDLRVDVYNQITKFKLKYFDQTPIGTLVTRAVSDIETIADIFAEGVLIILGEILKLAVVIIVMLAINWKLTLICIIPIPILLYATNVFKNYIKVAFQDVRTEVSKLNAFVQEHITGMFIVQIFNREKQEMDKFQAINARHRDAHIRTVFANSIFFPVVEILSAASIALLIWWGSREMLAGNVEYGQLLAFILFIYMLFRPIRQLADRFNTLQMGMVASERVFKILDTNERIEGTGENITPPIQGDISFKNVWFAYNNEDWILRDVSFDVKHGQKIAIVGATGAGKTSIINILSRFYEYNKGSITIDGKELRDFEPNYLSRQVGVVLQDVFLFSDSIYNNITLNNPEISLESVTEAAKKVGAHRFIDRLPDSYNYNVKERGGMLSVGQRQLLAFIRAYIYNPSILVLDEATSSVDTETENMIQEAIEQITKGRTSIIIAHRLATVQHADVIMVMDKGEIIEIGSHQELLRKDGAYKKLYDLQFV
ncbi:MAG: ABC transporter ATP-binding protein/permease [Salibacteraceae bacterium]|jgi:ATP-binding cassette, subfamily B, multidrug efflux pump|nr:ABC transporter ATP-binding protein/permease [Salibacteraceae bacterium]MDP4965662.1 ABC transporter ATP-binding protein/permease [Salibacteraceae bacterium]